MDSRTTRRVRPKGLSVRRKGVEIKVSDGKKTVTVRCKNAPAAREFVETIDRSATCAEAASLAADDVMRWRRWITNKRVRGSRIPHFGGRIGA